MEAIESRILIKTEGSYGSWCRVVYLLKCLDTAGLENYIKARGCPWGHDLRHRRGLLEFITDVGGHHYLDVGLQIIRYKEGFDVAAADCHLAEIQDLWSDHHLCHILWGQNHLAFPLLIECGRGGLELLLDWSVLVKLVPLSRSQLTLAFLISG